ncbi:MAG: hypothetical protein JXQ97_12630 [Natronospirillum sp.]
MAALLWYATSNAGNKYEFCLNSVGKNKDAIESELGAELRIESGEYVYEPTLLYVLFYSDGVRIQYDDQFRVKNADCAE